MQSLVIDAHEDLAFNALSLKRNLLLPISEMRKAEVPSKVGIPTISLEELHQGNVRIVFSTIWAAPCGEEEFKPCYSNAEEAHEQGLQQLEFYKRLVEQKHAKIITKLSELEEVVNSEKPALGLVLLMEGADPILFPEEVHEWFKRGVRIVGPAWHRTRYAGGTKAPGPLTEQGRKLMVEMENSGMILDTSHFAEESFFESLKIFHGTVIASHSNCRIFTPTDRQLSDDMIRAIASRDGVIGTVLCNQFLDHDWVNRGRVKSEVTLERVVMHMKHVSEIAGGFRHVAIGSDFDGGFGAEGIPMELDTVADLEKIGPALEKSGVTKGEANDVLGGNWLRVLRKALPA